jgi:hypothetical protein
MPIRAGSRTSIRVHPDGTSSRRASEIRAQLAVLVQTNPELYELERADELLDELNIATRWEYL